MVIWLKEQACLYDHNVFMTDMYITLQQTTSNTVLYMSGHFVIERIGRLRCYIGHNNKVLDTEHHIDHLIQYPHSVTSSL